ncbi:MAG: metal ABC transporter permease [Chloroflexota bacterium]|nr:metal ABC transporter permease [Chloroflexota bacterium]
MMDLILTPLQYPFMVRGLAAAVLVGVICATLGTYVVLRGMAFFGDALAHAILPGVAIGYLVGGGERGSVFWWALLTAVVSAIGIGTISRSTKIKEDTAIGIVFAGAFALGVALISTVRTYTADLTHFLFGDVLGVRTSDLLLIVVFGSLILVTVLAFYKEFLVVSFDPILAKTLRLPTRALDFLLMILIAVAIVVSLQTVGLALMVAMLVTPAATAFLLTRRLPVMMVLGGIIAAASGVVGLYLSFYIGIASGAAIVLTCTAIFGITWIVQTLRQHILIRNGSSDEARG